MKQDIRYVCPLLTPTIYTYLHLAYWIPCKRAWPNIGALQWRHNGRDGVSNHQLHDCLLNLLFWCRSKKTSKCHFTGLCVEKLPVTGEFPTQRANNVENVSISWRHHGESHNGCIYPVWSQSHIKSLEIRCKANRGFIGCQRARQVDRQLDRQTTLFLCPMRKYTNIETGTVISFSRLRCN